MILLNKRIIIALAVYILILGTIGWMGIRPLMGRIHTTTSALQERHHQFISDQQKLTQLKELDKSKTDIEQAKSLSSYAIPETLEQDRLLLTVEKIAKDQGVIITNLTIQAGDAEVAKTKTAAKTKSASLLSGLSSLQGVLDITGSYEKLRSVVDILEENQRIITIDSLNMTNVNAGGQSGDLGASIHFTAYGRKDTL